MPGVVAVYTPDDVPSNRFTLAGQSFLECSPYDTRILETHVRYVGDEVAMVVAETEEAASEAVKLVKVTYEKLPTVLDMEKALDNATVIHDEAGLVLRRRPHGRPGAQPRGPRRPRAR